MAKVVIFEDGSLETCIRYGSLVADHDVHVYMLTHYFKGARSQLVEKGFEESQIYPELPEGEIMPADIYFLDGLEGKCLEIFPRLPKEKAFLVSGNSRIVGRVQRAGFQVTSERQISRLVKEIS